MDKKVLEHFKKVDPILYEASLKVEFPKMERAKDYFIDLVQTIINQQLSDKAAATIYKRFEALMPKREITPQNVLRINDEKIRSAGISYSKIKYIKGVASEIVEGKLDLGKFDAQGDEIVMEELIKIKGIGPWSAEMFLMFSLGREDIFSAGDQGLKNAIKRIYKLKKDPTTKDLLRISSRWSPYRTYACRILWRSLSNPNTNLPPD